MSLAEILLVSVGLSFDVFAAMICEGAMLARVEKKKLIFICLIFCIWQQAAVVCGNLITLIPVFADSSREMQTAGSCLSMIIFVTLGIYMLWKAYRKEAFLGAVREDQLSENLAAGGGDKYRRFFCRDRLWFPGRGNGGGGADAGGNNGPVRHRRDLHRIQAGL